MVVDVVKAALDVALAHPGIRQAIPAPILFPFMRLDGHPDVLQGAVRAPSGPKPIGDRPELCLEDRLQECFDRALDDAILERGDTQGPELPWCTSFGDELTPRWTRPIYARAQFRPQSFEKALLTDPALYVLHGHPVDPGRAFASVRGYAPPRVADHARVGKPTPQIPPYFVRMCLASLIELALNAEYPGFFGLMIHVHRSLLHRCKSTFFLLPFALCAAFPRSDYYGSSALGVVHL